MTPQSNLTVVAPIAAGREASLRSLLAGMNFEPGRINPGNAVLPFDRFDDLHFARILILDDQTLGDVAVYGKPPATYPLALAFLADFDGTYETFLGKLVQQAGPGLRQIFGHCEDFGDSTDLLTWMKAQEHRPETSYVNWIGRTARQCREEARLRNALVEYLARTPEAAGARAVQLHASLRQHAREAGLMPSPEPATPTGWWIANKLHAIFMAPALAIALTLWSPVLLITLRAREKRDPEIAPPPDPAHARRLAEIEDHQYTNQFSAMGSLKPGVFRRWTLILLLAAIDYTARHVYNKGRLARVSTIHFARWVFIDNKQRLLFASNYDSSLESYMDDFINKVSFGLNAVFSNGIGYPSTRWLILDGAKDEQKFKHFIRRHELATEVWYNAHAGLSANDLRRNHTIRLGLESEALSESQAREWAALF